MRVKIPLIYVLLAVVLAGIIHIVAVLTLPMLAPKNAWARLVPLGPPNTMIQLPPPGPGQQVMPMIAPDERYAFCRFDLADGPVRLRAAVPDDLWLVAFYTPQGDNFYAVSGADMKRAQVDLIIATADQPVVEAGADAPEESDEVVVVKSPVTEGIAMIRAPLAGASRAGRAEEALKATFCGPHTH
jgi:uncharacterized membrane protein